MRYTLIALLAILALFGTAAAETLPPMPPPEHTPAPVQPTPAPPVYHRVYMPEVHK